MKNSSTKDLNEEIEEYFDGWVDMVGWDCGIEMPNQNMATLKDLENIARYFYDLGVKSQTKTIVTKSY